MTVVGGSTGRIRNLVAQYRGNKILGENPMGRGTEKSLEINHSVIQLISYKRYL